MLIFKITANYTAILYNSITSILLVILLCGCQPNVKEKLSAAEKRVKVARGEEDYAPPLKDYYLAIQEWTYWYQQLSPSDQLVKFSFIKSEEQGQIKLMVRGFRECYVNLSMALLDGLADAASEQKITREEKNAAADLVTKWRLSVLDTAVVLSDQLDSLLTVLEAQHGYFRNNCDRWQSHIDYLEEAYGIEVDELPCNIESIKKYNSLSALDQLEDRLLEEFQDSLMAKIITIIQ